MAIATLVAGLTGLMTIAGLSVGLPVPMVAISLLVTIAVVVIGIGVVRYSAFVHERTVQHDFFYNALLVGLLTLVYWYACGILVNTYHAPAAIMVLIPVLALTTHSLFTSMLRVMDRLFYRGETRQLRSNLRQLLRLAGEEGGLDENLGRALETLCASLRASYGLIGIFDHDNLRMAATCQPPFTQVDLKPNAFIADDAIHLEPGQLDPPLEEAALLVPLYTEAEQVGVLILGRPVNGLRYTDEDVEGLLASTDRMGEIILVARRRSENLAQIAQLAEAQHELSLAHAISIPVETVENALRNLYDYAFLADTRLAELKLVEKRLSQGQVTHLEHGKVVHEVLLEAIDKLRPAANLPHNPPPREWYPYLILHEAYIEEVSNRDIMQKFYISEGTFNRTRRSAIRSVARALGEMEAAIT
jgi:GAF domain-containing protein